MSKSELITLRDLIFAGIRAGVSPLVTLSKNGISNPSAKIKIMCRYVDGFRDHKYKLCQKFLPFSDLAKMRMLGDCDRFVKAIKKHVNNGMSVRQISKKTGVSTTIISRTMRDNDIYPESENSEPAIKTFAELSKKHAGPFNRDRVLKKQPVINAIINGKKLVSDDPLYAKWR